MYISTASAVLSASSVCPHVHKAIVKQGGERSYSYLKSKSISCALLSSCVTCPPRDDDIVKHMYISTHRFVPITYMVMKI